MDIVNIKNVRYQTEKLEILKGISFDIEQGDCISIIGQSGSGKSTLLKIIADLLPITSGDMYFRGESYNNYNPINLRRSISYLIQIPQLFGEKVWDNFEFVYRIRREKVDKQRIIQLLEQFNLDEGYLLKDINALSGGEKQRIAIIRNLLYTPELLLLDEATSALDIENARNVEAYVKELNDTGVTVVWITHNKEQSEGIFNKRITIEDGKLDSMEVLR